MEEAMPCLRDRRAATARHRSEFAAMAIDFSMPTINMRAAASRRILAFNDTCLPRTCFAPAHTEGPTLAPCALAPRRLGYSAA